MGNGEGILSVSAMLTKKGNATSIGKNVISFYVFAFTFKALLYFTQEWKTCASKH